MSMRRAFVAASWLLLLLAGTGGRALAQTGDKASIAKSVESKGVSAAITDWKGVNKTSIDYEATKLVRDDLTALDLDKKELKSFTNAYLDVLARKATREGEITIGVVEHYSAKRFLIDTTGAFDKPRGYVACDSDPREGDITVDAAPKGQTESTVLLAPPGSYTVKITTSKNAVCEKRITVADKETVKMFCPEQK